LFVAGPLLWPSPKVTLLVLLRSAAAAPAPSSGVAKRGCAASGALSPNTMLLAPPGACVMREEERPVMWLPRF